MPSRVSWQSSISTGVLALSSLAVAALIWTISSTEDKQRKRRRSGDDDDEEESYNIAGVDGRISATGKTSSIECARKVSDARFDSSMTSSLPNSGGSSWSLAQAGTSPWLSGVSGFSSQRQSSMSANEKRELDLMFRHQERHETRGPGSGVDLARAKHSARRRRGVPRGASISNVLDQTVDAAEEHLAEKLAEELLAEEAMTLEMPTSPGRAKKNKQKKPRKKNKARNAENQIETQDCDVIDYEATHHKDDILDAQCPDDSFDIEEEGTQVMETDAADFDIVSDDDAEQATELDCVVEEPPSADAEDSTSSVISSTRQGSFTSSTRQGSEAGDGDTAISEIAIVETADGTLGTSSTRQGSEVGDVETETGFPEVAVIEKVDDTKQKLDNTGDACDQLEAADCDRSVLDCRPEGTTLRPSSTSHSRTFKHRSWADVVDNSDDELPSVWGPLDSQKQKTECVEAVSNEAAGAHLLRLLRGETTSDSPNAAPIVVASVESTNALDGHCTLEDSVDTVDLADERIAAETTDVQAASAKAEEVEFYSAHSIAFGVSSARPGWVKVATRQRGRKGAKS